MSNSAKIDIDVLLNAILVNEDIRPAMLVQPQDYHERTGQDPKTLSIVNKIKELFPKLILSDSYDGIYQGTIISKKSYNSSFISIEKMGEILGYPCYKDINDLNRDKPYYSIAVMVSYNTDKEITLIVNVCKDKKTIKEFNSIAEFASYIFKKPDYKKLLTSFDIKRVYVKIENEIPTQFIINKLLIPNSTLTEDEENKFINILYNFDFSEKLTEYKFQYNNPIHRGIILDLLLKEKYDILSPFYPIQRYPKQQEQVEKITNKLEKALIDILNKTKIRASSSSSKKMTKRNKTI